MGKTNGHAVERQRLSDRADVPTVHCDVYEQDGRISIHIIIEGMKTLDETGALVHKLAMPVASTITEFYKQEAPKPAEFFFGPGTSSIH